MAKERIGLIGPGRMGLAMVKHLIAAGFAVTAYDVDSDRLALAREAGAEAASSPAEVGKASTFAIIAVGYDDETMAAALGADGLLETLEPGSVIAVSSTVAPDTVRDIEKAAAGKGVLVCDAPLCRGRWAADEGRLLALLGGTEEVVMRARPVYAAFSSDIHHLGEVGFGQFAKAMNNFLLWVNGIALIEAGRLSEAVGIDLAKLRQALLISSGKSQALEDWDRMSFTWAQKDMQLVSKMTAEAGLSLPIMDAIKELAKDAKRIKAENPPNWTGRGKET
jgi:3-hydroxyisobutyrate dehydrogenase/2-hydroxy-3-oxopropionate reductase